MRQPWHPPLEDLTLTGALFALSDPVRLGIVTTLADGRERGWGDFRVSVGKSTLSQHMKRLREAGVIRTRMEGSRCYVSLREDFATRFPGLLPAVLSLADEQEPGRGGRAHGR